jgi:hypothetical protein
MGVQRLVNHIAVESKGSPPANPAGFAGMSRGGLRVWPAVKVRTDDATSALIGVLDLPWPRRMIFPTLSWLGLLRLRLVAQVQSLFHRASPKIFARGDVISE